ncbi:MAG: hypothetical protein KAJ45_00385 [Desulfobulbaceae bacterium]|nr:hypothetical protein [Desulfobulbaceae bacterium]MCK5544360.1 hypothetical protein [Desulfobulbaceae bacterium]
MQKKTYLIFFLATLFLASIHQDVIQAEMRPINKLRAGRPPFEIMEDMTNANVKFTAMTASHPGRSLKTPPTPYITWLADPDARIQPELIMSNPQDKVYTVRVLGNQLELAKGSVDYGVRRLRSTILLITGNTGNQALRFYLEGLVQLEPDIMKDLKHLPIKPQKPEKKKTKKPQKTKKEKKENLKEKWLDSVEDNIDYQIEQALARYKDRVKSGRLIIVGGIIDLTNAYGRGYDRLIIISINGEKDDEKLRSLPVMIRLEPKILTKCVGRKRNLKKITN